MRYVRKMVLKHQLVIAGIFSRLSQHYRSLINLTLEYGHLALLAVGDHKAVVAVILGNIFMFQ